MAKRQERLNAIELRKQGWPIPKIAKEVGVCFGTALKWCHEVTLTSEQLKKIKNTGQIKLAETRKQEKKHRADRYRKSGADRIIINDHTLLLVGTALYWAEGDKVGSSVRISNSDPGVIRVFLKWLKECFNIDVERLRYQLHIHEGLNENYIKKYWENELRDIVNIEPNQWYKTQIKKSSLGHRKHLLYKGTFYAGISDTNLLFQIEGMIQGLQKKLWVCDATGSVVDF